MRQQEGIPAATNALPLICQAVSKNFPPILDSEIHSGEGIVKALALIADFVMLGRPVQ